MNNQSSWSLSAGLLFALVTAGAFACETTNKGPTSRANDQASGRSMRFEFDGQRMVPTRLQNTPAALLSENRIGEFILPKPRKNESYIVFRDSGRRVDTIYKMNNGNGEIAYFFNGDNRMLEITIDRQPIIEVSSGRLWSVDAYRGDPAEALLKALEDRDMTIMSKLLNSNPSLSNTTYSGGMTLLMFSDSPRVTRMALGAGADVNAKDINGSTPLHYAAYYGHIQIAELLIARKANVNAKNFFGNTPLHFAMSMGKEALGDYLIKCGADTSIRNSAGQTPLGIALDN